MTVFAERGVSFRPKRNVLVPLRCVVSSRSKRVVPSYPTRVAPACLKRVAPACLKRVAPTPLKHIAPLHFEDISKDLAQEQKKLCF